MIVRARAGDTDAFERLFQETHARLYNFLRSLGHGRDEAADLTQEAYVRAWERIQQLNNPSSFISWLHQIARNLSRDRIKSGERRYETALDPEWTEPTSEDRGPEEVAEGRAITQAIQAGIISLPEAQRLPVVMHHLEGMEVREIARALNISYGTVLSRLARGRAALARKLAPFVDVGSSKSGEGNVVRD